MARRRRPGSRTSVLDGRAEVVVPLESVTDVDGNPMSFGAVRSRLGRVTAYPCSPVPADPSVAVVLDRFAFDLHLADVALASDTHDGPDFFAAACTMGTIAVFVVDGVDPRRSKPDDIDAAARTDQLAGGLVVAYPVDALQA
ncbi:MAG: hypothetical protein ABJH68_14980 [Ilumatobacter sp.]|uniref:hypothetical protein n=1 Tax=Ilumatobacter sp. TaxID=1967498 RepID=UPI00329971BE